MLLASMRRPTVLVIGAGHSGLEAAFAAARVGARVRVVTGRVDTIGQTPCNPSIGGVAKGHLVREIDALGGFIGRAADACAIHGRVLNRSKGPAVRSTRVQVDKARYGAHATAVLTKHPDVEVIEGLVTIVVTTGTFLGGILHTGDRRTPGGRVGEAPATGLSRQLAAIGFRLSRLKTGTPPRIDGRTIDWDEADLQPSEDPMPRFTLPDDVEPPPPLLPQVDCYLTWTTAQTHALIRENLHASPMYSGQITGRGPRYCPSIEDKVVRFAHRERHQVFLEPEGLETHSVYPNGISTSLPADVQAAFVATIPALRNAMMLRPGYAVEYDAVDARALTHALRSKDHEGLFFAGQVNGTSGYEEAAAQGIVAGANAALSTLDREPLHIGRADGYIGVLVDDLVTQGCDEPYRMFTSRAEHRLLLRIDNADLRLTPRARQLGLIPDERWTRFEARRERFLRNLQVLDATAVRARNGQTVSAARLLRQPDVRLDDVRQTVPLDLSDSTDLDRASLEIHVKYAGYLQQETARLERTRRDERRPIPDGFPFSRVPGLSREVTERLYEVLPETLGQASRIPGMTPAAVAVLGAYLDRPPIETPAVS
jgi:tRNA uridine 5-carboxymethylaminomethyl modification enzyme